MLKTVVGLAPIAFGVLLLIAAFEQEATRVDEDAEPAIKRLEPKEPGEAAKTFAVLHGFRMEMIAHEPLLRDPVAITYDENGAMYLVEMTAYPHPERADDQAFGQVRMLLDQDGDAEFDSSFVLPTSSPRPPAAAGRRGA